MDNLKERPGILLAISAPLGAGKITLCEALLDREPMARLSVSCTTRSRRSREVEGHDFFFLTEDAFRRRAEAGEFLEWVTLNGQLYGTPRQPVMDQLSAGRDVVLNVDARGAQAVKEAAPEAVTVFVCPPSWEALAERLKAQDPAGERGPVAGRLVNAKNDVAAASGYDYVVVSDNLVQAADDLAAILRAERNRARRAQPHITRLLEAPFPVF